ncbi:hypothetical protein [Sphingopyxis sp. SE2]|uniref:hypothetical protein n=1 Tax=Sphingopyxis sp. SE2 TaxID=1586240 RepID=UPI0028C49E21|nr:hypothetical protein [Sphingopyxis sp. SE2]
MTGWEEEEVIFLEAKLAWARVARNSRSSNSGEAADFSRSARKISRPRHASPQCTGANPPLN